MVRRLYAFFRQQTQQRRIAALSGGVDVVKRLFRRFQSQHIRDLPVHAGGPQRTPEGDDQRLSVVHAQQPFRVRFRAGEKVFPHRRTRHDHLFRAAVGLPAGREPDHNPVRVGFQQFCRQAGFQIGLVYRRGDVPFRGGFHGGITRVTARSDHHIRLKLPENGPGLMGRAQEIDRRNQVVPDFFRRERAVKTGDMDHPEGIARLFNQIPFQTPVRAHKQKFRVRIFPGNPFRQRNRRIHMTRRAAAGEQYPVQLLFQRNHPLSKLSREPHPRKAFLFVPPPLKGEGVRGWGFPANRGFLP